MKAIIYARVSTDKQDTEMQKKELIEYAKLKSFEIVSVIEDLGYTGKNTQRPGLTELRSRVKDGGIDIVLVWKIDRLARSLKELLELISEFSLNKTSFVSLKDSFDLSTPQGKLTMQILGAVAEFELSLRKARCDAGIKRAKETRATKTGKWFGNPDFVKTLPPDSSHKILKLRALGKTYADIAKELAISKSSAIRLAKSS